jgi:hypothetical protein
LSPEWIGDVGDMSTIVGVFYVSTSWIIVNWFRLLREKSGYYWEEKEERDVFNICEHRDVVIHYVEKWEEEIIFNLREELSWGWTGDFDELCA